MTETTYLFEMVRDAIWGEALEQASDYNLARIADIVFSRVPYGQYDPDRFDTEYVRENRSELESCICDAAYTLWQLEENALIRIADLLDLYW